MDRKKKRAMHLRSKGYSLSEISLGLGISKSTASFWLREIPLSRQAKELLAQKKNAGRQRGLASLAAQHEQRISDSRKYALEILSRVELSSNTSRLVCSLLYWCEGVKLRQGGTFCFMNSDPNLVRTFMRLLRDGFGIDELKLRLQLHLHEYQDAEQQLLFWSNLTNIPLSQCNKPYLKPHSGVRIRDGYQGCASIRYLDLELGRKIEAIGKMFIETGP